MKISILTLFPEMFYGPFEHSIVKRAQEKKLIEIEIINIRDFGIGPHKLVDDTPYGGGKGMVMRVDVLSKAIEKAKCKNKGNEKIILMDPRGEKFSQKKAKEILKTDHLIIVSARYEGVDERIKHFVDESISIGDYILTGGEIPAMVVTDAIVRLLPGVIKIESSELESFSNLSDKIPSLLLEYPQYTKPREFEKLKVPEILLSGQHQKINEWRKIQALAITQKLRPDLLKNIIKKTG